MAAEQSKCNEHYWTEHLKMMKMVNFSLCVFLHLKYFYKKYKEEERIGREDTNYQSSGVEEIALKVSLESKNKIIL